MNANALQGPRIGIMVHYSDGGFVETCEWCRTPKGPKNPKPVSYNSVIAGDGAVDLIVPYNLRAWHAGVCQQSAGIQINYRDANSAFEGIALSGGPSFGPPTDAQITTLIRVIADRYAARGWDTADLWRITGHEDEAWPRGRKQDPSGGDKEHPWLDLEMIRRAVAAA